MIDRLLSPKDLDYDFEEHNTIHIFDWREWSWWQWAMYELSIFMRKTFGK